MNNALETRYFLSAMTGAGYYALHRQFLRPPERYFCILKGGPGCGKSSLMRRVAQAMEEKGASVEYIACSGDPDSLDAVVFPALNTAIVDGTAPHG
jgi:ABC-type nitrate/sulfonate/bicarbonate transport system ATPase subunit